MAIICPTITAAEPHEYRAQIERVKPFARRLHIDLADGVFAPVKLIDLKHVWWPDSMQVDIHLMYESVAPFTKELLQLKPNMVIIHAESAGKFYEVAKPFKEKGIRVGVALLQDTEVHQIVPALPEIDHVLIFSGDLGHFGGHVNLALLSKITELRSHKPDLEIGWDGGIGEENARRLVIGGVDVLNVGGGIQRATDPAKAYATLESISKG
jgi:ribulose-phosphate 3-epimerase